MPQLGDGNDRKQTKKATARFSLQTTGRSAVSLVSVVLTHLALSLVPRFSHASPFPVQLLLSAVLLLVAVGLGRWCRLLAGVRASAPALVFFNILFVWAVYFVVIRQAVPQFVDLAFNGEVAMLLVGVYSILSSDPGFVSHTYSHSDEFVEAGAIGLEARHEGEYLLNRARFCKSCKAFVKGHDHHCPAFGNCIGEKNYALFMVLLVGFVSTEASYILCSFRFIGKFHDLKGTMFERNLAGTLVVSTTLFSLLQVLWQGVFIMWHVYCICFNIRTDEWINWKKYPEFHVNAPAKPGESFVEMRFRNPYDKGILQNVKEFLEQKN